MTDAAQPPQIAIAYAGTDRRRAEALSQVFEAMGYRLAPQPLSAHSVEESAALVALWSSGSVNSGPINALASQAALARKLVCVRTAHIDPPAAFSLVSLFDLSAWTGPVDYPQLRGLIEHLSRMAPPPRSLVREQVAAPPTAFFVSRIAEPAREAPPRPNIPAPAKTIQPPSAEAIAWMQIQHSDDPNDFREHLEIFGEQGVYAHSARGRLRALEASPRAVTAEAAVSTRPVVRRPPPRRRARGMGAAGVAAAITGIAAVAVVTYAAAPSLLERLPKAEAPQQTAKIAPAPAVVAPAPNESLHAGPIEAADASSTPTAAPVAAPAAAPVAVAPVQTAAAKPVPPAAKTPSQPLPVETAAADDTPVPPGRIYEMAGPGNVRRNGLAQQASFGAPPPRPAPKILVGAAPTSPEAAAKPVAPSPDEQAKSAADESDKRYKRMEFKSAPE